VAGPASERDVVRLPIKVVEPFPEPDGLRFGVCLLPTLNKIFHAPSLPAKTRSDNHEGYSFSRSKEFSKFQVPGVKFQELWAARC